MADPYIIYGGELSYFTRKLEAALIFYGLDFELRSKNQQDPTALEARAGTHQVPLLQTPENWLIADTTPLLKLLDSRVPDRRLFPTGPIGVLVYALEEYFDEWLARTMVHYRWNYPASAEFASLRMAEGNPEVAARVRSWGPKVCRATGMGSAVQQQAGEAEYLRLLQAMEAQLAQTPYLLGHRPTAVDAVVLGGLRAHTNMDPDPKAVTQGFPRVVAYADGAADNWDGSGELLPFPESTPFADQVLAEMASTYQPYVLGNRDAQQAGAKAFHADIYGESVSYLSRPYPERSRQMLMQHIRSQLNRNEQQQVQAWLQGRQLECFL